MYSCDVIMLFFIFQVVLCNTMVFYVSLLFEILELIQIVN